MNQLSNRLANGSRKETGLRTLGATAVVLGLLSLGSFSAVAASDDTGDTATAANARAVRLSNAEGSVRVTQDGQIIADPATANLPLFAGSQVQTGSDGQAEVQLEDGSVLRLSPNSVLTFAVMDQQGSGSRTEVVLNSGLAYFELQPSTAEHSLRISYGSVSFTASSFSIVRIAMDTPPGELAVMSGNLHLERGSSLQLDLHGGESLTVGTSDLTHYDLSESIEPNSWDSWNSDRDQALNAESAEKTAASGAYANSQAVGMTDLDANGSWYDVPGEGYIWSPYEAQSGGGTWDPYGFGRWVYYPRFGYVWVSGYGWGYAPYSCGLWNYYDTIGWGWAPGAGGCNPWWNSGAGWGYGIGNGPRGYRPPGRPLPGPRHPHPIAGRPLLPASVIPVDRRHGEPVNFAGYNHPSQPVVIGGHTVEPLRPIAPRPVYDRPGGNLGDRPSQGYYGGGQPVYGGIQNRTMPVYTPRPTGGGQPVYHPAPSRSSSSGGGGGGHPSSGGGVSSGGGGHAGGGAASSGGGGSHK